MNVRGAAARRETICGFPIRRDVNAGDWTKRRLRHVWPSKAKEGFNLLDTSSEASRKIERILRCISESFHQGAEKKRAEQRIRQATGVMS